MTRGSGNDGDSAGDGAGDSAGDGAGGINISSIAVVFDTIARG